MDEQLKQIGERLRGLREVLDVPAAEVAALCGISIDDYTAMESGEADISVANLQKIAQRYDTPLDVLMFGEEPHMSSYFLTRRGGGTSVERQKAYKYQSLAGGFRGRKAEPFFVTVEPTDTPPHPNTHDSQEFESVVEGRMELTVGSKTFILEPGDSIYFDANRPHSIRALDGKTLKFLAIII